MSSPLPPDPYLALGVAKDATAAQIKQIYRKLVLKCHPDKIQDPAKKMEASDQFHRIQTAYEIVGDEERRRRYDAQVKLAELRRAAMEERRSAPRDDMRSRSYTAPQPTTREYTIRERYEERRPSDAYGADYTYDMPPRATTRKDDYFERPSSKRPPPRAEREKPRTSTRTTKESERARGKEKTRKADKEIKRDRERKYAPSVQSTSESETEQAYERASRMREEEAARMARADEERRRLEEERRRREEELDARDTYYEQLRRDQERSPRRDYDDPAARANKYYDTHADAKDYINRSRSRQQPEERGPSPVRVSPTRSTTGSKPTVMRDRHGRPQAVRKASSKPSKSAEPARKEPRTKAQAIVDDELPHRPSMPQSYSSPETIRIPSEERQRSSSMEYPRDQPQQPEFKPPPMSRAQTMPTVPSYKRGTVPTRGSNLRTTQINNGQPTPEATPDYETSPTKSPYGREYADDHEYPTPNGYQTEERVPREGAPKTSRSRLTRSPEPMREKQRPASSRYPAERPKAVPLQGQRTTSYKYRDTDDGVESVPARTYEPSPRPTFSREGSSRATKSGLLFGEMHRASPTVKQSKYSPPPEDIRYRREPRTEDVRPAAGHGYKTSASRRPSMGTRPSYGRSNSYLTEQLSY